MEEPFRSTEISDPRFESDNLRFITVKTANLKGRGDICLFLPPTEKIKNLPLVVLLHGVYGSAWVWSQKAGVHQTAMKMIQNKEIPPMAIAMPSDGLWGDGSAYLPHHRQNFEKWIVDDVPNAVMANIASISATSPLFICGLSMGGFGALRIGIKYAEKFNAISAHSAITHLNQMPLFVEEPLQAYLQEDELENSVLGVIKKYGRKKAGIRFDCGTEDELITYNRELHAAFNDINVEHSYEEFPGGHEWAYWQEQVKRSLRFFSEEII